MNHITRQRAVFAAALLFAPLVAGAQQAEPVDLAAIARIREEGIERSKVMEITSWLTDVYGPRLSNSPNIDKAADWAMTTMKGWGLANVSKHAFPFGRGWQTERFTAQVTAPVPFPVIAYPGAWSGSTSGVVKAEVVLAVIDSEPDFARYAGKLRGKVVMTRPPADSLPALFRAPGQRYTEAQLAAMAEAPAQQVAQQGGGQRGGRPQQAAGAQQQMRERMQAMQAFNARRAKFFEDEGVAVLLSAGRGDGGNVFVSATGSRANGAPQGLPTVVVSNEHYGRIARIVQKGIPVTMEIESKNAFFDADSTDYNIIAEIPGTDPRLKDEVVMIGAHFDSWHAGTGATDNASGSAVMMEAMRILKASGVPLKRTVRIGLWSGEEQGLIGSRRYVRDVFGDTENRTPAHAKFAAYFNVDNGTGQIRGIYQQGNAAVGPIFKAWMEPFKDWGVGTTTIRNTGGTDHLSFTGVGLPGFQFIQDPIEYSTRTHHSSQDVYERIQAQDMKRNAVLVAAFAYLAANRAEKLPR